MNKQKGIASIAVMGVMLFLAIALPVTTNLVKKNQENRSKAATGSTCSSDRKSIVGSDGKVYPCSVLHGYVCYFNQEENKVQCGDPDSEKVKNSISSNAASTSTKTCAAAGGECVRDSTCSNTGGSILSGSCPYTTTYITVCCSKSSPATNPTLYYVKRSTGYCVSTNNYANQRICSDAPPGDPCFTSLALCNASKSSSSGSSDTKRQIDIFINGVCKKSTNLYASVAVCNGASDSAGKNCYESDASCRAAHPEVYSTSTPNSNVGAACTGYLGRAGKCISTDQIQYANCAAPGVDNGFVSRESNTGCTGTNVVCCATRVGVPFWDGKVCKMSDKQYIDTVQCSRDTNYRNTTFGGGTECYDSISQCYKEHPVINSNVGAACTGYLGRAGKCISTDQIQYANCAAPGVDNGFVSRESNTGCTGTNVVCCATRVGVPFWDGKVCKMSDKQYIDTVQCSRDTNYRNTTFGGGTECYDSISQCYKEHPNKAKMGVWDGKSCRLSSNSYIDAVDCERTKSGGDAGVVCYDSLAQCQGTNAGKSCTQSRTVGGTKGTCVIAGTDQGDFSGCLTTDGQNGFFMKNNICGGTFTSWTSTRCCVPLEKMIVWDGKECKSSTNKYIDGFNCQEHGYGPDENVQCYESSEMNRCNKEHPNKAILAVWDTTVGCRETNNMYTDATYDCETQRLAGSEGPTATVCFDTLAGCLSTGAGNTCSSKTTSGKSGICVPTLTKQDNFVCYDGKGNEGYFAKDDTCGSLGTFWWTTRCCLPKVICDEGEQECLSSSQTRICTNNEWVNTICNATQSCVDGVCKTKSSDMATVNIKLAFAGVKTGNNQCAVDWPVSFRMVDSDGEDVDEFSGIAVSSGTANSNGEVVYSFTGTISNISSDGIDGLSFFIDGPKHLSMKYGEDGQTDWFNSRDGSLSLQPGSNNYNFSTYSLLAGDVTGDSTGVPDGKIDGRDYSFIKGIVDNASKADDGTNVIGDIDGNCQVNSNDVDLVKKSLIEINSQKY